MSHNRNTSLFLSRLDVNWRRIVLNSSLSMTNICKTSALMRAELQSTLGKNAANKNIWNSIICRLYCSQGRVVEKTDKERTIHKHATRSNIEKHELSNFQKRLLYTSGRYDSMAAVPNFAGESELRNATDVCKTLFNIWCMMFLAAFAIFVHNIEKRRMRRDFARIERKQQRRMREFDRINRERLEKLKVQKTQVAS